MSQLKELKRYAKVMRELAELAEAEYLAALLATQFHVGDIIMSGEGDLAKVTKVFLRYGKPKYVAYPIKPDGTLESMGVRSWLLEWEFATLHTPSPTAAAAAA